jgi:nicotinate-nucleotide pyrophosphorylase (carboxylating)
MSIDASVRAVVESAGLPPWLVDEVVSRALIEDLGAEGDVTTLATVPATLVGRADLVPRTAGIVAGLPVAAWVFDSVGEGRVRVEFGAIDGTAVTPGEVLASLAGPVRDLLTAERTALNLLGHLSGVATLTRRWVDAVAGTGAVIRDTRKTLPGLRALEKYAVRCGGGTNHRMSLSDAALVKDNHVAAAGVTYLAVGALTHSAPVLDIGMDLR